MTGAYLTHDGGATWRIDQPGDTVQFFDFDPLDASVIYARAPAASSAAPMPAEPGSASSRATRRPARGTTTPPATCVHGGASQSSAAHRARHRPRRLALALPRAGDPLSGRRSTPAPLAEIRRSARTRRAEIWIDPRSPPGDRTLYVAGRRRTLHPPRGQVAHHAASRDALTEIAGAPPVFYATVAGKIHVSTDGGVTWRDSALPGFQGEATAIAASAGPSRDRLRLLQRTARARPHHLGRGQNHRFRPPLGCRSTTA